MTSKDLARDVAARIGAACIALGNYGKSARVERTVLGDVVTYEVIVDGVATHRVYADATAGECAVASVADVEGLRAVGLGEMADRAMARKTARAQ